MRPPVRVRAPRPTRPPAKLQEVATTLVRKCGQLAQDFVEHLRRTIPVRATGALSLLGARRRPSICIVFRAANPRLSAMAERPAAVRRRPDGTAIHPNPRVR